jgi:endonuclease-3 related protein
MTTGQRLNQIYQKLLERFGPQHWWPGDTPFEIIVGAILTQNTNWGNVEKAISNLKASDVLTPDRLHGLPQERLADLIRPAGYYNIKAVRLTNFLQWLFTRYQGDLAGVEGRGTPSLREELLAIKGIGPETADSILLYAFDRPIFVVDAYTARVAARHGLIEPPFDYHQLQEVFQSSLQQEVPLFNEYHALLVRVGKEYCKPTPRCKGCPLEDLPHTVEP